MKKPTYKFKARVWIYSGAGGWHFVNIPMKKSKEIENMFGMMAGGWGSLPVMVSIGKTNWKTSIFPDKKTGTYLLPLKADVRKKESFKNGDTIKFSIEIQV